MKKIKSIINNKLIITSIILIILIGSILIIKNINSTTNKITGLASLPAPNCIGLPDGCVLASKPWICINEQSSQECSACGCPTGNVCLDDGSCTDSCDDGTLVGQCSNMNAGGEVYFCRYESLSVFLELDCSVKCDCPSEYKCNALLKICEPLPPPPITVCGDSLCGGDETCESCPLDCGECHPQDNNNNAGGSSGSSTIKKQPKIINQTNKTQEDLYIYTITEDEPIFTAFKVGDEVEFYYKDTTYNLLFNYISGYLITTKLQDTTILIEDGNFKAPEETMIITKLEETTNIDIDGDSKTDLKISYIEFLSGNNYANVKIELISEKEQLSQIQDEKYKNQINLIIIYLTIAISSLIIAFILIRQSIVILKNKNKKHINKRNKI